MTDSITLITPNAYFKSGFDVNENNIKAFRHLYRTLTKIDQFNDHETDETSLLNAAQRLGIQADSDDHRELLEECVKYDDMENTFLCVNIRIQGPVEPSPTSFPPITARTTQHSKSESKVEKRTENKTPTTLAEIDCVLTIKCREKQVDNFLHKYLLQVVKACSTTE